MDDITFCGMSGKKVILLLLSLEFNGMENLSRTNLSEVDEDDGYGVVVVFNSGSYFRVKVKCCCRL